MHALLGTLVYCYIVDYYAAAEADSSVLHRVQL